MTRQINTLAPPAGRPLDIVAGGDHDQPLAQVSSASTGNKKRLARWPPPGLGHNRRPQSQRCNAAASGKCRDVKARKWSPLRRAALVGRAKQMDSFHRPFFYPIHLHLSSAGDRNHSAWVASSRLRAAPPISMDGQQASESERQAQRQTQTQTYCGPATGSQAGRRQWILDDGHGIDATA